MYLHNKNNMRHFCITNKKKQKTSIFIFGQWVFWPIVVIVLLVIIFILPGSHVITLFGDFTGYYPSGKSFSRQHIGA